jgi:flagellar protein FlbD
MLTRISGSGFVLNCDLIERVDSTPDTIVSLVDGKKYVVLESPLEVVAAVRRHRAEIVALSNLLEHTEAEELLAPPSSAALSAPRLAPVASVAPIEREG